MFMKLLFLALSLHAQEVDINQDLPGLYKKAVTPHAENIVGTFQIQRMRMIDPAFNGFFNFYSTWTRIPTTTTISFNASKDTPEGAVPSVFDTKTSKTHGLVNKLNEEATISADGETALTFHLNVQTGQGSHNYPKPEFTYDSFMSYACKSLTTKEVNKLICELTFVANEDDIRRETFGEEINAFNGKVVGYAELVLEVPKVEVEKEEE